MKIELLTALACAILITACPSPKPDGGSTDDGAKEGTTSGSEPEPAAPKPST